MKTFRFSFLKYFWWLRHLAFLWIKSRVTPKDVAQELNLDTSKLICYVIKTRSFKDLLVLDKHCEDLGLPMPRSDLNDPDDDGASSIYLAATGLFQESRDKRIPEDLTLLIERAVEQRRDLQLVPVSIFWGRNPGKEERSLFKILFFDDEYGGWLQRFITFFVQGRNVHCHFGKPISVNDVLAEKKSLSDTSKKLRRVLRVHFRTQRDIALGPYLYDRRRFIDNVIFSKSVQAAVLKEAEKSHKSKEEVENRARAYANELAAALSPNVIRFLDILLSWVFKKIFSGVVIKNSGEVEKLAKDHVLVYLPSHRSHIDYLLLNYVVFNLGVTPPHTIAGINLNFWPVGPILRKAGAIFIRRSFSSNRLYSEVVRSYLNNLVRSSYGICLFQEGGRSRTGKLLSPKSGILSMLVRSKLDKTNKPILLIPVYLAYDRVVEASSYIRELGGSPKKTESFRQLFSSLSFLKKNFGHAYVSFGKPYPVDRAMAHAELNEEQSLKISNIAKEISVRTNNTAVLSGVSLFCTILLSTPKSAIAEKSLLGVAQSWLKMLKAFNPDLCLGFDEASLEKEFELVLALVELEKIKSPLGEVVVLGDKEGVVASYYKNNTLHLFSVHALVASFFKRVDSLARQDLISRLAFLYPFIAEEFFLPWVDDEVPLMLEKSVDSMVHAGLLQEQGQDIKRSKFLSEGATYLQILGNSLGSLTETWAIYIALLASTKGDMLTRDAFIAQSQSVLRDRYILGDANDQLFFDPKKVSLFVGELARQKYISMDEQAKIQVEPKLRELAEKASLLMESGLKNEILPHKVEGGNGSV